MPYNDAHSDVFSNPPELKKFENLPPQVMQRVHAINSAVENITRLHLIYADNFVEPAPVSNPIIDQINKTNSNFTLNDARNAIGDAYGEEA